MRDRCPYLRTLLACLALLLGACGPGTLGGALSPEQAPFSLEDTETLEAEESLFVRPQRAQAPPRAGSTPGAVLLSGQQPRPARENPRRSAPPHDAWERPKRC